MSSIFSVSGPSGGKLAYILGCSVYHPGGQDWEYPEFGKNVRREVNLPIAINYGCKRSELPVDCINYDSEDGTDKTWCFKMFDAYNIPHPRLINPSGFKGRFLGRDNGKSKGYGIRRYNSGEAYREHNFYVEYLEGVSEHRVHVWGSHVLIELNKRFGDHEFIQSSRFGSRMVAGYIKHKDRLKILDKSVEAVSILGLDYGAVDILVDKNNKYYVLEVNSAPSLAGIFGQIYAEHINRIMNLGVEFGQTIHQNKIVCTSWEKYSKRFV